MSATVLNAEDGSGWVCGWLSAVIAACLFWSVSHVTCYDWVLMCVPLKSIVYSRDHSGCCGITGAIICLFINLKVGGMHVLKSWVLQWVIWSCCIPSILVLVANDPPAWTVFWQDWLLTVTLWSCSLSFNALDMVLIGFYRFLNHASASLDGCCLYVIIQNGMLQWDWRVGSVPWYGRAGPEFFKAEDAYAYG